MNTLRSPSEPRSAMTWPDTWAAAPPRCSVCGAPTVADRCLDSSHGPGWRCSCDASHYWQVRTAPLRRYLRAHPPPPQYPWYDTSEEERRAWLAAHYQPPRLVPSTEKGGEHSALDRAPLSQGQSGACTEAPSLPLEPAAGAVVRPLQRRAVGRGPRLAETRRRRP